MKVLEFPDLNLTPSQMAMKCLHGIVFEEERPIYLVGSEQLDFETCISSGLADRNVLNGCSTAVVSGEYYLAKGLIVVRNGLKPLFIASAAGTPEKVEDVTFFVSCDVFKTPHADWVIEQIKAHKGSTFIKPDISSHFGTKVEIPAFQTVGERKEFFENLAKEALEDLRTKE